MCHSTLHRVHGSELDLKPTFSSRVRPNKGKKWELLDQGEWLEFGIFSQVGVPVCAFVRQADFVDLDRVGAEVGKVPDHQSGQEPLFTSSFILVIARIPMIC